MNPLASLPAMCAFQLLALIVGASVWSGTALAGGDAPPLDWSQARAVPIVTGLEGPANFALAPDGSIWYAEVYRGNLSSFDSVTGLRTVRHHVNSVASGDERGLVGFALDPAFEANGVFFLYYTEPTLNASAGLNKLVRIEDGRETVLALIPGAEEHNGGRILITPDGTMFVSTGENQLRWPAQDPKSLLGKVLRMTLTGEPVAGNLEGLVFSKGHRNVYGLAYDPGTKELWATENSGWRRDEVNIIRERGNYGYPECEGLGLNGVSTPCPTDKGYTEPIMTFYENGSAAPTGATFWRGEFYWASLREGSIHHLWQDAGAWKDEIVYKTEGMLLDLHEAPDGASLYFSTWEGISRLDVPSIERDHTPQAAPRLAGVPGLSILVTLAALVLAFVRVRPRA